MGPVELEVQPFYATVITFNNLDARQAFFDWLMDGENLMDALEFIAERTDSHVISNTDNSCAMVTITAYPIEEPDAD